MEFMLRRLISMQNVVKRRYIYTEMETHVPRRCLFSCMVTSLKSAHNISSLIHHPQVMLSLRPGDQSVVVAFIEKSALGKHFRPKRAVI